MAAVIEFAGVTVKRGRAVLLDSVDWVVEEDERWVVLGPNGAGKTTLLQVAAAQIHPTAGVAGILEEVLGTVDVFELRPRIGLTSAALGERILAPFLSEIQAPGLEGDYCQNAGLTPLGETLIQEMMLRGMIVEVDHLPRRSAVRAYEILSAADYPPAATHGNSMNGLAYRLGGISTFGLNRCADPARTGSIRNWPRRGSSSRISCEPSGSTRT